MTCAHAQQEQCTKYYNSMKFGYKLLYADSDMTNFLFLALFRVEICRNPCTFGAQLLTRFVLLGSENLYMARYDHVDIPDYRFGGA